MADNKATEIPKDPYCDDDNPTVVNFERISAAAYRIHGGVVKTPCDVSRIGIKNLGIIFIFKLVLSNRKYNINIYFLLAVSH